MMSQLDHWIFESYQSRRADLAFYRILYASYMLMAGLPIGFATREAPMAFFNPPLGPAALFTDFLPSAVMVGLNAVLVLSLCALLIGCKTRLASIVTFGLIIVLSAFSYATGLIGHDILRALVPLVMAFSGWGSRYSIDARSRRSGECDELSGSWALALLAMLVGLAMFTAGWAKASTGWLDPRQLSTYGYVMKNYFVIGRQSILTLPLMSITAPWFWKPLDLMVVGVELAFPFFMFQRRTFLALCSLACFFHLGVWLMFGIQFSHNVMAYAAFVPYSQLAWPAPLVRFWRFASRTARRCPASTLLMGTFVFVLLNNLVFGLEKFPGITGWLTQSFDDVWTILHIVVIVAGAAFALAYLRRLWNGSRKHRKPSWGKGQSETLERVA